MSAAAMSQNLTRAERWRRRRQESGYAAIVVAIFAATVLFPLSALAVDVARWYVEVERVQAAADAASMAGVTYLPNDFASATSTAKTVSARNGYPDGGTTSVSDKVGEKPTQLVETVSSTVRNSIAAAFTNSFTTVTRSATADYNGPVPMGSPCNTFGNEPAGTNLRGPAGSQLVIPAGGANCSTSPKFWAGVEGPNVYKTQGDQLSTRYCKGYESGCDGSNNNQ
ncbi:MAG: pilus assembly protein TadG-related protein [Nocardioides sp.]